VVLVLGPLKRTVHHNQLSPRIESKTDFWLGRGKYAPGIETDI